MKPESFEVKVHGKFGVLPVCMEEDSVGYDIALPPDFGNLIMPYSSRRTIDTGIVIKPPMKCFVLIVPRSSSRKRGIRISNTVGVVDPSYCGQDDHLIVDLTREPKKIEFVGKISTEEIVHQGYTVDSLNACYTFRDKMGYSDESFVALSAVPDLGTEEFHIFEDPADEYLVYGAGDRFCQILFLPFYKPELLEAKLEEFGIENRGGFGSTGQ